MIELCVRYHLGITLLGNISDKSDAKKRFKKINKHQVSSPVSLVVFICIGNTSNKYKEPIDLGPVFKTSWPGGIFGPTRGNLGCLKILKANFGGFYLILSLYFNNLRVLYIEGSVIYLKPISVIFGIFYASSCFTATVAKNLFNNLGA